MQFQWIVIVILYSLREINAQIQTQQVEIGTLVRLMCRPKSDRADVPTTYEWIDPRNVSRVSNIQFEIPNFSEANAGIYTCKATQILDGQVATTQVSILVQIKDSLQVVVPETHRTFASGILFLKCDVKGKPLSNYKFEWISPTGERQATSTYFKNGVGKSQSGVYTCRVTQGNQVFESRTFVTVNDLPIKIEKISGSLTFGEVVKLKCEMDKSGADNKVFTRFTYTWFDPKNQLISNDQEVSIKLDDMTKFGTYQCRISSQNISPQYIQSQLMEIRFSSNTGDGGRNPGGQTRIYTGSFTNSPKIVRYFDPLELNCGINPPVPWVTYQIHFNDKLVSDSNRYVVPRLGKEHLGIYQCIISGRDPSTGQTVDLRATFTIQPEFKMGSKIELTEPPGPQIFVRAGDKRELHCEIGVNTGLQGRNAEWYFNGRLITQNDFAQYNIQVLPRLYVSIMILKGIQQLNEGKYECRVQGETKEAYILVMAKSRTIEVNPNEENRKVGDGKPVEFHCRIGGYRTKNRDVTWTFMSKETGQIIPLEGRWSRSDDPTADETSFIILQQAELSDAGTYICTEPDTRDTARGVLNVISDLRIVVTPPIIKLRAGQTATFQCYVLNAGRSPDYPDFFMANGGRAADSQRTTVEKLEAGKVQLTYRAVTTNDNGTKFTCRKGRSTADVLILVDPVCSAGSRLCRNGECINSAKFCDNKRDCADGSDEDQEFCRQCDPLSKRCETHNGQTPSNPIYQAHWACDGEDDCGNGFDESKCLGNVRECGGLTYQCNDGTKAIPKAFLCDKDTDCTNGDDESRCLPPIIMEEPQEFYKINARKGETVTLTCQVSGYPLPKIIWRFNWGCLTNERRMVVSESYKNCQTTISVLTISEFQPGDDGIYNCEALSGGKRAWSKDYQLMMNFRN